MGFMSSPGSDPFNVTVDGLNLYPIVPLHDPIGLTSADVYATIARNIEQWVEDGIVLRSRY
jgi:hypothetical protein